MLRGFSKAVIKKLDLKIYSTFSLSQDFSKKFAEKKYKEILGKV